MNSEQSTDQATQEHATGIGQPVTYAQKRFYASDLCKEARVLLQDLVDNPQYNTDPSAATIDPVEFVERHLRHLSAYPTTNLAGYMSNLKLMTNTNRSRPAS